MYNRFRMSNQIFDYRLSANELHIYAVMCSVYSNAYHHDVITVKQSTIAEKCGLRTTETVSRAISSLCRKGLIRRVQRFTKRNGELGTYHYTLALPRSGGRYFFVPRSIIGKLNSVQMRMYLFICKCLDSRTGEMWNSYTDISNALRIKRSAAIETIKELIALKVIERIQVIKKDGSYSDNHYRLFENITTIVVTFFKKSLKRKESRCSQHLLSLSNIMNVQKSSIGMSTSLFYYASRYCICQVLFFAIRGSPIRGSPLKNGSLIVPTLYIQREKLLSYIYQHSSYA